MEWYERYKDCLNRLFEQAESRISLFPPPLDAIGLRYADGFHPVKRDSGKDYICTLLPYWLRNASSITDEQCERLALANVYGMLYFFIQDDVMDGTESTDWKEQLALGNLFYLAMLAEYRGLFPSESPFWPYFERYVSTWADCVVNEQNENYFLSDPLRTAGKAAPVKLASTASWLLTGQAGRIQAAETAIDYVLMTLQMLDDWSDWMTDLEDGSYNGLLAMIAEKLAKDGQAPDRKTLTKEQVKDAIYVSGCMGRYTEIACGNHERLCALPIVIPELTDFHSHMLGSLRKISSSIDSNKRTLLKGGLNYYFNRQSEA